jgi:hypothetical protein
MNYKIYIPFVNNKPMLLQAIDSLGKYKGRIVLIDNSKNNELLNDKDIEKYYEQGLTVYTPSVPLFTSQTFNLFTKIALDPYFIFMHSDGLASEEAYEKLCAKTDELIANNEKWGMIFTHYDVFCMFNKQGIIDAGGADTELHTYFFDNDLYRRMNKAGFKEVHTDIGKLIQHRASSTINSDPHLMFIHKTKWGMYQEYYRRKWGGTPGQETFNTPFGR